MLVSAAVMYIVLRMFGTTEDIQGASTNLTNLIKELNEDTKERQ